MTDLWNNNEIQFARLLCELDALGVPDSADFNELTVNMDLSNDELASLFARAQQVWDKSKENV